MIQLTQQLNINDTEIHVNSGNLLPELNGSVGVVWIGKERIEYASRDGNILRGIKRATKGTSLPVRIGSDTHQLGSLVHNGDADQVRSGKTILWQDNLSGTTQSYTPMSLFLTGKTFTVSPNLTLYIGGQFNLN